MGSVLIGLVAPVDGVWYGLLAGTLGVFCGKVSDTSFDGFVLVVTTVFDSTVDG
jgi:hypothetical protein